MRCFKRAAGLLLAGLLVLPTSAGAAPRRAVVDRVVAVIDNEIITERELMAQADGPLQEIDRTLSPDERAKQRRRVLQQALDAEISERLLTREVRLNKDKLGVADKDIDRAVDEVMRLNHINREQLQTALYGQGLTWTEYRDKLRVQLERTRLVQFKVQGKVQVREGEVRRRCQERLRLQAADGPALVCASHILLKLDGGASPRALEAQLQRARALRARLVAGEPIAALAAEHSDDPSAKDGALGCFGRGEMVEAFEAAAFALEAGGTSEVVRTPFGLHLIQVSERRAAEAGRCDTPEATDAIRNELMQEEMGRQMALWMAELREQSFVEVRL
jgi:peptidyl-prolyl cis-trans isomerase SurA